MVRRTREAALLIAAISMSWMVGTPASSDEALLHRGANPHLANGATALTLHNFDEGIRQTERGLSRPAKHKHRSAALSNLCAGFDGREEYETALLHCNAALEIDDSNWQAYGNRALAHLGLGDLEKAKSDVDRGLELNPESPTLRRVAQLVADRSKPR